MKIRNVSGDDRLVPALGGRLVLKGQVVDVPDAEHSYSFTQQVTNWEPADDEARTAHEDGVAAQYAQDGQADAAPAGDASASNDDINAEKG